MRRDSFLGQVLMAVARSTPAESSILEVARDNPMARPPSQLVTAIARSTPAFTPGSIPALDAVQRRAPSSSEPAASFPHVGRVGSGEDILEFGLRVSSSRRRVSYRQALTVAVAGFAIPVIVASILFIETTINFSSRSTPTPPVSARSASPTSIPAPARSLGSSAAPNAILTYGALLNSIPATIQGNNNCTDVGTDAGAEAGADVVAECSKITGLAAQSIFYYSFSSHGALTSGFNAFLAKEHFEKSNNSCTIGADQFTEFVVQCEDEFTNTSKGLSGDIAEYMNTDNAPIIVSTDNQQLVMVVMIGTDGGNLLSYWKKFEWIVARA